jgi:hypothetical protein
MPFFARPNLDNEQFKQLSGTTLTLSGTTQIAEQGGFQLPDGFGGYIPVHTYNPQPEDVLKYVGGCLVLGTVSTGGTSTGIYDGLSPAAIEVGGIDAGYILTGKTITCILQDMLVPTLYPTLSSPYSQFCISPAISTLEIGCGVSITGCINLFNRGCINPQYGALSDKRVGTAVAYAFSQYGNPATTGVSSSCSFASHTIVMGNNTLSGCVCYSAGVQPKDSSGADYLSACTAGVTCSTCSPSAIMSRTITGIHPWFYGSSAGIPTINSALLSGATCKCVAASTSDIVATNYNVTGQHIWFAIPATSTSMLKWQGSNSPSNCGTIPGDLFASETTCVVNSPSSCWSGVNYRFYVSNYPTSINYCMTFKRS